MGASGSKEKNKIKYDSGYEYETGTNMEVEEHEPIKLTEQNRFQIAEYVGQTIVPARFPKTLVLSISSHGNIERDAQLIQPPPGIRVVKMNSVIPNIANFISEETLKAANDYITKKIEETPSLDSANLVKICEELRSEIVKYAKKTEFDVEKGLKSGYDEHKDLIIPFLHSVDRGYSIIQSIGQDKWSRGSMLNKKYTRTNVERINPFGDWQIKALNVPGQPDIMLDVEQENGRRSAPGRNGEAVVWLSEIIDFCVKRGAKRLLIFDFSCGCMIDDEGNDIDPREGRAFAREMIKQGISGGSKKRKQNKNTKKYKKPKKITKRKKTKRAKKI